MKDIYYWYKVEHIYTTRLTRADAGNYPVLLRNRSLYFSKFIVIVHNIVHCCFSFKENISNVPLTSALQMQPDCMMPDNVRKRSYLRRWLVGGVTIHFHLMEFPCTRTKKPRSVQLNKCVWNEE